METMGPTQARIPMLNVIHLLQSQIYGKPNVLDGLKGQYTCPYT